MSDRLQNTVADWIEQTFPGSPGNTDLRVRALRLLEKAIEVAQAVDLPLNKVLDQVTHVYSRPPGNPVQELAGVMLTAMGFADALGVSAYDVGMQEVQRNFFRIDEIRAKNAQKVKVDA